MTQTELDERIVGEFVAGDEVPAIAARYNVTEAYVDRVVEETSLTKPKKRDWSWNNWGNRLLYSVLAAMAMSYLIGSPAIGWTLGVALFALTTAIVAGRKR